MSDSTTLKATMFGSTVRMIRKMPMVRGEGGVSLLEVVISLAVLAVLGVAFLGAIGTSIRTGVSVDERETAKNLAESQMEYVKSVPFADEYSAAPRPSEYADYFPDIETAAVPEPGRQLYPGEIQKVTVVIEHRGREVARLVGYKTR